MDIGSHHLAKSFSLLLLPDAFLSSSYLNSSAPLDTINHSLLSETLLPWAAGTLLPGFPLSLPCIGKHYLQPLKHKCGSIFSSSHPNNLGVLSVYLQKYNLNPFTSLLLSSYLPQSSFPPSLFIWTAIVVS